MGALFTLGILAPRSWYCCGFFRKFTNSIISSLASSHPATSLSGSKKWIKWAVRIFRRIFHWVLRNIRQAGKLSICTVLWTQRKPWWETNTAISHTTSNIWLVLLESHLNTCFLVVKLCSWLTNTKYSLEMEKEWNGIALYWVSLDNAISCKHQLWSKVMEKQNAAVRGTQYSTLNKVLLTMWNPHPVIISKLWYPVQFMLIETLSKTWPQISDPIQEKVYFSCQSTLRVMKVLVSHQSDVLMPRGACNPTLEYHPECLGNSNPLKTQTCEFFFIPCLRQGSLKTIPYPVACPRIGKIVKIEYSPSWEYSQQRIPQFGPETVTYPLSFASHGQAPTKIHQRANDQESWGQFDQFLPEWQWNGKTQ